MIHQTTSNSPTIASHAASSAPGRADLWAVILAGGEGSRLSSVSRRLYGENLPEQFAALSGGQSLLQQTVTRLKSLVPPERMVVVVARNRRDLAEEQLHHESGLQLVAQPENSGTGPGVFLPLSLIKSRAPDANVVVTPSDHHLATPALLIPALRSALQAATAAPSGVALIGAEADAPETGLGWIIPRSLPSPDVDESFFAVDAFVEKPSAASAAEIFAEGGLWNTMITVGSVAALWRQGEQHLPVQLELFAEFVAALARRGGALDARTTEILTRLYRRMPPADFSRTVLQRARGLAVVPLRGAGWRDCGTPAGLLGCLDQSHDRRTQVVKAILHALHADSEASDSFGSAPAVDQPALVAG